MNSTKKIKKNYIEKRWALVTGYDKLKNLIGLQEFSGIKKTIIEQNFYAGILMYNIATTVKFDIEKSNLREIKNKDKKYNINRKF